MNYGDTWPTGAQAGGPAITHPVRDRTERLAQHQAFKAERGELPAILAPYKPRERAR